MIEREQIMWAHRCILGREPESEAAIESFREVQRFEHLRRIFLDSYEFRLQGIGPYSTDRWLIAPVRGGRQRAWVNIADRVVSYEMIYDLYEPEVTDFLTAFLQPGQTALDVGACLGWHTLLMLDRVGPSGHVISFEPNPETFARLSDTLEMNGLAAHANAYQVALGAEPSRAFLSRLRGDTNLGNYALVGGAADREGFTVELRGLDSFCLPACDVIKIDVEGFEPQVLKGGLALIEKHRPVIVSEVFDKQLRAVAGTDQTTYIRMLTSLGYRAFALMHDALLVPYETTGYANHNSNHNVVFWPEDRLAEVEPLQRVLAAGRPA